MTARTPEPTEGTRMSESLSGEAVEARKAEWAMFDAITTALNPDDPTHHVKGCGYSEDGPDCGCADLGRRLREAIWTTLPDLIGQERARAEAAVRERVEAVCPQCQGAGEVVAYSDGTLIACESCRWVRAALAGGAGEGK